jgi:hypothetical protein
MRSYINEEPGGGDTGPLGKRLADDYRKSTRSPVAKQIETLKRLGELRRVLDAYDGNGDPPQPEVFWRPT